MDDRRPEHHPLWRVLSPRSGPVRTPANWLVTSLLTLLALIPVAVLGYYLLNGLSIEGTPDTSLELDATGEFSDDVRPFAIAGLGVLTLVSGLLVLASSTAFTIAVIGFGVRSGLSSAESIAARSAPPRR